ncbi:MAG: radical SAM protein [Myxococcota bacterium]
MTIVSQNSNIGYLVEKLVNGGMPASASIELTSLCNFRCLHCYLGAKRDEEKTLTADKWKEILREMADAGCLSLLITGGEPLLYKDFADVYSFAKKQGFIVTLFTNGSLLGDEHIELFKRLPPFQIELSFYGSEERTYSKFTGTIGAFERVLTNTKRMIDAGIRIGIKTMLARGIVGEFDKIRELAGELGVSFRYDGDLCGAFGVAPSERLSARELVNIERTDAIRVGQWRKNLSSEFIVPKEQLFVCGAGKSGFHIAPDGTMHPCLLERDISISLLENSFIEAWKKLKTAVSSQKRTMNGCDGCEDARLCGFCPPVATLEGVSRAGPSPFHCELAELRKRVVKSI